MSLPSTEYDQDWVLYLRKSKGKAGITRQRKDARALADELNGRIVAEFTDVDATAYARPGAQRARRDDYQELLKTLERPRQGKPLGVLAWHADRLHRNPDEVEDFIRVCAQDRHPVRTVRSGLYELWTPTGRKRIRQDAVDAAYEVDHLTERIDSHKIEAAQAGRWLGGPLPFGFRSEWIVDEDHDRGERRVLLIEPGQAEAIRWGSEAVLRGVASGEIGREWGRRGIWPTDRRGNPREDGKVWTTEQVTRILKRARNAALMVHQGVVIETLVEGGSVEWDLSRQDGTVVVHLEAGKAEWEPILTEEVWRAVAEVLSDPGRRTSPGPAPRWLGSGLYRCGVDGCDATVRSGSGGDGYLPDGTPKRSRPIYRCKGGGKRHVVRDSVNLDAYVEKVLVARLIRPDLTALITEEDPVDLTELKEKLKAEKATLESWRRLAEANEIEPVSFARVEKAALPRIEGIKAEMKQAVRVPLLDTLIGVEDIAAFYFDQPLAWRRAVVDLLMTVTIRPAARGRPRGWKPGTPYFDVGTIDIAWKKPRRIPA